MGKFSQSTHLLQMKKRKQQKKTHSKSNQTFWNALKLFRWKVERCVA